MMTKKAILLIHGMGAKEKTSLLSNVVNEIATWIDQNHKSVKPGDDPPSLNLHLEDDPPSIELGFGVHGWKFVEVWWADSVQAPRFDPMIGWTVKRFIRHLLSLSMNLVAINLVPFVIGLTLLSLLAVIIIVGLVFILPLTLIFLFVVLPYLFYIDLLRSAREYRLPGIYSYIVNVPLSIIDSAARVLTINNLAKTAAAIIIILASVSLTDVLFSGIFLVVFVVILVAGVLTNIVLSARHQTEVEVDLPEDWILNFRQMYNDPAARRQMYVAPERLLRTNTFLNPRHLFRLGPAKWLGYIGGVLTWSLRDTDEELLVAAMMDPKIGIWGTLRLSVLVFVMLIFHGVNALVTIPLYVVGAALIIPLMFVLWLLSLASGIQRVERFVNLVKARLDSFLIGSLGDIKVFMDEPAQARRISGRVEAALDSLQKDPEYRDADTYIVAHSTGAAIAYEAMVLDSNKSRTVQVRKLITVGAILRMVPAMSSRRSSFVRKSFPRHKQWLNIWTRYDPALPGPMSRHRAIQLMRGALLDVTRRQIENAKWRKRALLRVRRVFRGVRFVLFGFTEPDLKEPIPRFNDVCVSNESDPFHDHSAYWDNDHQVIPRLVSEIFEQDGADDFDFQDSTQLGRVKRRKYRVLALSAFRLAAWALFPVTLGFTWVFLKQLPAELSRPKCIGEFEWFWPWERFWTYLCLRNEIPTFILRPEDYVELALVAVVAAVGVTIVGQLSYRFLRAISWDGFFQDWRIFRASS